ncbi:hypothetical protein I546_3096 [Mycobacterium kansasii 732]|nr:hypothetical protein I546_3096 [Mycobacterium kansasii 732]
MADSSGHRTFSRYEKRSAQKTGRVPNLSSGRPFFPTRHLVAAPQQADQHLTAAPQQADQSVELGHPSATYPFRWARPSPRRRGGVKPGPLVVGSFYEGLGGVHNCGKITFPKLHHGALLSQARVRADEPRSGDVFVLGGAEMAPQAVRHSQAPFGFCAGCGAIGRGPLQGQFAVADASERCHQGGTKVGVQLADQLVHVEQRGSDVLVIGQIQVGHLSSPLLIFGPRLSACGHGCGGWNILLRRFRAQRDLAQLPRWSRADGCVGVALALSMRNAGMVSRRLQQDVGRDRVVCPFTPHAARLPKFHPNATANLHFTPIGRQVTVVSPGRLGHICAGQAI